jgi:hypothetical protein
MVFRLGAGAVAEVVVPLGLAKAGFLSGCTFSFFIIIIIIHTTYNIQLIYIIYGELRRTPGKLKSK